jgi:hypothetical protein
MKRARSRISFHVLYALGQPPSLIMISIQLLSLISHQLLLIPRLLKRQPMLHLLFRVP